MSKKSVKNIYCFYSPEFKQFLENTGKYTKRCKFINKLIKMDGMDIEDIEFKATFIDFGEKDNMVSYISPTKLLKLYKERNQEEEHGDFNEWLSEKKQEGFFFDVKRTQAKIGRFLSKMLGEINDAQVEEFVNLYKAHHSSARYEMKVVYGDDIIKYYNTENYNITNRDSSLACSCMNIHGFDTGLCGDINTTQNNLKFYSLNKNVGLLILKCIDSDKIKGRALIWKLKSGKKFIDVPYVNHEHDYQLYEKYAIDNQFLSESTHYDEMEVELNDDIKKLFGSKSGRVLLNTPYLDTFNYDYYSNTLIA